MSASPGPAGHRQSAFWHLWNPKGEGRKGLGSDCITQRLGFPGWAQKVRDFYSEKSLILQLSRTFFGYFLTVYVIFYPAI